MSSNLPFNLHTLTLRERIVTLLENETFWAKVSFLFSVLIEDLSDLISAEYLALNSVLAIFS